nr:hypothetical protein [Tolivirales sp.]
MSTTMKKKHTNKSIVFGRRPAKKLQMSSKTSNDIPVSLHFGNTSHAAYRSQIPHIGNSCHLGEGSTDVVPGQSLDEKHTLKLSPPLGVSKIGFSQKTRQQWLQDLEAANQMQGSLSNISTGSMKTIPSETRLPRSNHQRRNQPTEVPKAQQDTMRGVLYDGLQMQRQLISKNVSIDSGPKRHSQLETTLPNCSSQSLCGSMSSVVPSLPKPKQHILEGLPHVYNAVNDLIYDGYMHAFDEENDIISSKFATSFFPGMSGFTADEEEEYRRQDMENSESYEAVELASYSELLFIHPDFKLWLNIADDESHDEIAEIADEAIKVIEAELVGETQDEVVVGPEAEEAPQPVVEMELDEVDIKLCTELGQTSVSEVVDASNKREVGRSGLEKLMSKVKKKKVRFQPPTIGGVDEDLSFESFPHPDSKWHVSTNKDGSVEYTLVPVMSVKTQYPGPSNVAAAHSPDETRPAKRLILSRFLGSHLSHVDYEMYYQLKNNWLGRDIHDGTPAQMMATIRTFLQSYRLTHLTAEKLHSVCLVTIYAAMIPTPMELECLKLVAKDKVVKRIKTVNNFYAKGILQKKSKWYSLFGSKTYSLASK